MLVLKKSDSVHAWKHIQSFTQYQSDCIFQKLFTTSIKKFYISQKWYQQHNFRTTNFLIINEFQKINSEMVWAIFQFCGKCTIFTNVFQLLIDNWYHCESDLCAQRKQKYYNVELIQWWDASSWCFFCHNCKFVIVMRLLTVEITTLQVEF